VVLTAAAQALMYLPLALMAVFGVGLGHALGSAHLLIGAVGLIATIYYAVGIACGPAWTAWMGIIVPPRVRAGYYASRNRWLQGGTLAGLILGGTIWQFGKSLEATTPQAPLYAFGVLFLLALAARAVSAYYLWAETEPAPLPVADRTVPKLEVLRRFWHGREGRFILYLLCTQFAVNAANPFLNPYLIKELRIEPGLFAWLIAAVTVGRFVMLPMVGRFAKRHGPARTLWIGGIGIVPLSLLWILGGLPDHPHAAFAVMLGAQFVAGLAWAFWDMGSFLLFFDTIDPEERSSILSTYHFANSVCIAAGSLLGLVLTRFSADQAVPYVAIFAISAFLRGATLILLGRAIRLAAAPNVARTDSDPRSAPDAGVLHGEREPS
jgi:MFS family permease